jgi:hypothetical protein
VVASATVDGGAVEVTGLVVFGWPSTLVEIELDPADDRTRSVAVELRD